LAAVAWLAAAGAPAGCRCAGVQTATDASGPGDGAAGADAAGSGTDGAAAATDGGAGGATDAGAAGPDASAGGSDAGGGLPTDAGPGCNPVGPAPCAAMETCGNGLDDDCDGAADDFCICSTVGATQPCFDGNAAFAGVGACAFGTQTCVTGLGEFPYWSLCAGDALPTSEICDGADNDCNSCADEGGVCGSAFPIAVCPADITDYTLSTAMWTGSGSDDGTIVSYGWTLTSSPPGSASTLGASSGTSSSLFLDEAGDYLVELCVTDDDGQTDCCTFTIHSIPSEIFRVELTWDVDEDLDLHLAHLPTATHWNVGVAASASDCMWANCTGMWGLDWDATTAGGGPGPYPTPDDDPHLDLDSGFPTPAMGPENINIAAPDEIGYRIGVHYYGAMGPPSMTTATLRVYCNGVDVYTDTQLMTAAAGNQPFGMNDFWVVADVDFVVDPVTGVYTCTVTPIDMIHPSSWAGTSL
jgi:hypothetical protein